MNDVKTATNTRPPSEKAVTAIVLGIWLTIAIILWPIVGEYVDDWFWQVTIVSLGAIGLAALLGWVCFPLLDARGSSIREQGPKVLLIGQGTLQKLLTIEKETVSQREWDPKKHWIITPDLLYSMEDELPDLQSSHAVSMAQDQSKPGWLGMVFVRKDNRLAIVWHEMIGVSEADRVRLKYGELTEKEILWGTTAMKLPD